MNNKIILTILLVTSLGFSQTGGNFAIDKAVIANGGGQSNSGDFQLSGTVGQTTAANSSTGGGFALAGGFWRAANNNNNDIIFENGFE